MERKVSAQGERPSLGVKRDVERVGWALVAQGLPPSPLIRFVQAVF
jgi:hypothetical protein